MNHLVLASSVFAALSVVFLPSVEAGQQCMSCTSHDCYKSNPSTKYCDKKCFTILLREDSPDEEKPFKIKGCTTDVIFTRRRCDNKCYDEKKKFGGIEHYMCVHCCTGDKCNSPAPQLKSGITMVFAFAVLALGKYFYF